jgi:hypothetical protein
VTEETRSTFAGVRDRADTIDLAVAGLAALLAFCVYLATLYPGLLGIGDAAKFSFVGKVLGTPHAPGYPLYILVSHLFSYVPWGTLAYRMNALSALLGAITTGLSYLLARRLGVGRMAAVSTSLALAFGSAFWAKSLYAKGYTLNAALVSAGIFMLLRWHETRRSRDLYWAVAIFALSLGNHLTVIALLPALLLFVVLADPRTALRPRTLAIVFAAVALGFSQYLLILVRTLQHAPYLEARATNLGELWAVMTARRFAHEIGAFSFSTLMTTRVPIVGRLVASEIGLVGILLLAVGFGVLLARRPLRAMLFGLGALGVAALTANMGSNEDEGFLLPAFVLLWPVIAVGLDRVLTVIARGRRRPAAAGSLAVALLMPGLAVAGNYRLNDHHAETADAAYFDSLFAALPNKAAIVSEEYRVDMMVLYKLLGERANGARDIREIAGDPDTVGRFRDQGFEVFAFEGARRKLTERGFHFVAFQVPPSANAAEAVQRRPISRLASAGGCMDVGNVGWVDIGKVLRSKGRVSVRIDNYAPFDSKLTIYAGGDAPGRPLLAEAGGAGSPRLEAESFRLDDQAARRRLAAAVASDGTALPDAVAAMRFVTRTEVRVNDRGAFSVFSLDLGEVAGGAIGRALVDRDAPKRATICSHDLGETDAWPPGESHTSIALDADNVHFGNGWYALERRADGTPFRWTASGATLVVPIAQPRAATVTIAAELVNDQRRSAGAVTLVLNGHTLGARTVPAAPGTVSWDVPCGGWRAGLNEFIFEVDGARRPSEVSGSSSSDTRILGVSITAIDLTARAGATGPCPH